MGHKPFSLLAAFLLLFAGAATAQAQSFPKLTGPVVDAAGIIPDDQEPALVTRLAQNKAKTGREFVVVTVPSLEGYAVSDYGYKLGRFWQLGKKGENEGLLLLVAPKERQLTIEVGNGLEAVIPDAVAHAIIQKDIRPRFKANDYAGGINAGVSSIITQLQLPPEEAAKRAQQMATAPQDEVDIGAVIFWLFIFFFFIMPIVSSMFRRGKRGRRMGTGPVIIWGGGSDWGSGSGSSGGSWGGGGDGSDWGGGGGSFGGGGASGDW